MIKKKEINILVAMKREALPLINYWNLKLNSKKFYSNKKKGINLIISGIGKKKAEKATVYLAEKTNENSFFLNIGIAGHKDFKLGSREFWEISKDLHSDDDEDIYDPNARDIKKRGPKINVKKNRW